MQSMHSLYNVQAGDASGTGFFDTANRCYDKSRMDTIDSDLHSFLPQLIGPDEVIQVSESSRTVQQGHEMQIANTSLTSSLYVLLCSNVCSTLHLQCPAVNIINAQLKTRQGQCFSRIGNAMAVHQERRTGRSFSSMTV